MAATAITPDADFDTASEAVTPLAKTILAAE